MWFLTMSNLDGFFPPRGLMNLKFVVNSPCPVGRRGLRDTGSLIRVTHSPTVTLAGLTGFTVINNNYDVRII